MGERRVAIPEVDGSIPSTRSIRVRRARAFSVRCSDAQLTKLDKGRRQPAMAATCATASGAHGTGETPLRRKAEAETKMSRSAWVVQSF
jgi:hypothetical protein